MGYSVNRLTTVSECDSLLGFVTKEKEDLLFKRTSMGRQTGIYQERSVEIGAEQQSVAAELAALRLVSANLPDGPSKTDNLTRIKKLELREFLLINRSEDFGIIALVDKEYDLALVENAILETDKLLQAVQARKQELA